MKKISRDLQMFREAIRTRGFWHDLAYTSPVPIILAFLVIKYRDGHDIIVLLGLVVSSFVLCAWYALSNGYVLFTYGTVHSFTISEMWRRQAVYRIHGFLPGRQRLYGLTSYWAVDLKVGETILVLRHPYRDSIGWITKRSAQNHGQFERFQTMQTNPLPMYYEDMLRPPANDAH